MDPSNLRAIPLFADLSKKQLALAARIADEINITPGDTTRATFGISGRP